jgi:urease accessory protein
MLALACLLWPALALAHVGQGDISGGFLAGVAHPVLGPDHVVAMVAVGIWGAQLGAPAIWVLPVTFPIVMAFGGVLGGLGVPIPGIEIGIALSAIVLGGVIAACGFYFLTGHLIAR